MARISTSCRRVRADLACGNSRNAAATAATAANSSECVMPRCGAKPRTSMSGSAAHAAAAIHTRRAEGGTSCGAQAPMAKPTAACEIGVGTALSTSMHDYAEVVGSCFGQLATALSQLAQHALAEIEPFLQ